MDKLKSSVGTNTLIGTSTNPESGVPEVCLRLTTRPDVEMCVFIDLQNKFHMNSLVFTRLLTNIKLLIPSTRVSWTAASNRTEPHR